MPAARFQVLWHSVTIDVSEGLAAVPDCTWPMSPVLEMDYRLVRNRDGWEAFQGSDSLGFSQTSESALMTLRVRILARSFELAMRKGWSAFTGTVITIGDERMCLVGPADERRRAAEILDRMGAAVDSHDGWIALNGEVLAVPVTPTQDRRELTIRPIDRLLLWRADGSPPAGPEALMALLECADRSCQKAGDIVRSATAVINRRQLFGTPAGQIPGWYVA